MREGRGGGATGGRAAKPCTGAPAMPATEDRSRDGIGEGEGRGGGEERSKPTAAGRDGVGVGNGQSTTDGTRGTGPPGTETLESCIGISGQGKLEHRATGWIYGYQVGLCFIFAKH